MNYAIVILECQLSISEDLIEVMNENKKRSTNTEYLDGRIIDEEIKCRHLIAAIKVLKSVPTQDLLNRK